MFLTLLIKTSDLCPTKATSLYSLSPFVFLLFSGLCAVDKSFFPSLFILLASSGLKVAFFEILLSDHLCTYLQGWNYGYCTFFVIYLFLLDRTNTHSVLEMRYLLGKWREQAAKKKRKKERKKEKKQ